MLTWSEYQRLMVVSNITIGDNGRLRLGASQDLDIYHDNTNSRSRIEHSTDNTLEILQAGNAGMLIQNAE